jgi:hypothetical protein
VTGVFLSWLHPHVRARASFRRVQAAYAPMSGSRPMTLKHTLELTNHEALLDAALDRPLETARSSATLTDVEEVEVVMAHAERAADSAA